MFGEKAEATRIMAAHSGSRGQFHSGTVQAPILFHLL